MTIEDWLKLCSLLQKAAQFWDDDRDAIDWCEALKVKVMYKLIEQTRREFDIEASSGGWQND